MIVQCDSIGSMPERCSACGAAKPHDVDYCEPCPWNKEATCMPVFIDMVCTACGGSFKGNEKIDICPTCYA